MRVVLKPLGLFLILGGMGALATLAVSNPQSLGNGLLGRLTSGSTNRVMATCPGCNHPFPVEGVPTSAIIATDFAENAADLLSFPAEKGHLRNATATRHHDTPGHLGTGVVQFNTTGAWVDWTVEAPQAGEYQFALRYANRELDPQKLQITRQTPQGPVTLMETLHFPRTGVKLAWEYVSLKTFLKAGRNIIRATSLEKTGPTLDHLVLIPVRSPSAVSSSPGK
jgi:hypothetical protein